MNEQGVNNSAFSGCGGRRVKIFFKIGKNYLFKWYYYI